jgi:NADPH:quinone reductase-like Zn-dependent oxidoreductase
MAGEVVAVGKDVTEFSVGDDVYALLTGGGFGEYVSVPASLLAPMPSNLSHAQAAAVPIGAVTALVGLRDSGRLQPGHRVLVNGASGGVGTFAVQIAVALGATVTGVCSTRNLDLVRSLGASSVVDYTTADFTRSGQQYDLLLDIAGGHSLPACRRVLAPNGIFVVVGGPAGKWFQPAGHAFGALAVAPLFGRKAAMADTIGYASKKENLTTLTELIEAGKVTPVIDRHYTFEQIPDAVRYQEQGHAAGKVVVTV